MAMTTATHTGNDIWLAGVDGCPGAWLVAFGRPDGEVRAPRLVRTFAEIVLGAERPAIIAIDIPIGLPAQSPAGGRLAEREVRALLGMRKSSVFRIPSRRAVEASVAAAPANARERFFAACAIARETSDDRKAFAKQGFYILDKVSEVDAFLRGHKNDAGRVFETHPELAFIMMNGGAPLALAKKVKNHAHAPGLALRRELLVRAGIPGDIAGMKAPKGAGGDDLIDSLACLVTARRIHAGLARSYPLEPPRDEHGLPMAIWG
jgi:predicted RNase H-like nuclease